jgi:hypothetical protein
MMDITVIKSADGRPLNRVAYALNITERKRAEAEIAHRAEELHLRNQELHRFNAAMVGRELDMIELKRQVNALAERLGEPAPHNLGFVDAARAEDET